MRWRTAILVLIPTAGILGWLAIGPGSPNPQAKSKAATPAQSEKRPNNLDRS
jgi:hypothetical protein